MVHILAQQTMKWNKSHFYKIWQKLKIFFFCVTPTNYFMVLSTYTFRNGQIISETEKKKWQKYYPYSQLHFGKLLCCVMLCNVQWDHG
jgi:hypothetical protein